jgi:ribonuclease T1
MESRAQVGLLMSKKLIIAVLASIMLSGTLLPGQPAGLFQDPHESSIHGQTSASRIQNPESSRDPSIRTDRLPSEARKTLQLIRQGGPFPYPQDGVVFGNRERLLPAKPRGYYREYTVKTPGAKNRGARRIIAGKSGEFFYTDDHYSSFKRIVE